MRDRNHDVDIVNQVNIFLLEIDIKEMMNTQVLIVEDDPTSTEIIRITLKNLGYDLKFVTNGKDAYSAATKSPPAIVLMDIRMPDWDGLETCKIFKSDKALAEIPIIFVTSATNDIEKAFSVGGADYVVKPLRPTELKMRINFHLERMQFVEKMEKLNIDYQRKIDNQISELATTHKKLDMALKEIASLKGN
jgi:DNA-binding response OmpR family regulator